MSECYKWRFDQHHGQRLSRWKINVWIGFKEHINFFMIRYVTCTVTRSLSALFSPNQTRKALESSFKKAERTVLCLTPDRHQEKFYFPTWIFADYRCNGQCALGCSLWWWIMMMTNSSVALLLYLAAFASLSFPQMMLKYAVSHQQLHSFPQTDACPRITSLIQRTF